MATARVNFRHTIAARAAGTLRSCNCCNKVAPRFSYYFSGYAIKTKELCFACSISSNEAELVSKLNICAATWCAVISSWGLRWRFVAPGARWVPPSAILHDAWYSNSTSFFGKHIRIYVEQLFNGLVFQIWWLRKLNFFFSCCGLY